MSYTRRPLSGTLHDGTERVPAQSSTPTTVVVTPSPRKHPVRKHALRPRQRRLVRPGDFDSAERRPEGRALHNDRIQRSTAGEDMTREAPGAEKEADIVDGLDELRAAGLLATEPTALFREWLQRTLEAGLTPEQVVELAEDEGVKAGTFDVLDGLEVVRDPVGNPYVRLEAGHGARDVARVVELLNGGRPSATDARRSANGWTYHWPLLTGGAVALVLGQGGAVVATPEGILMAAPGPKSFGLVPSAAAVLSFQGGTTWGELFVLNKSSDDPAGVLHEVIARGFVDDLPLLPLLAHERVHSEQWARYGRFGFLARYLTSGRGCDNRTSARPASKRAATTAGTPDGRIHRACCPRG